MTRQWYNLRAQLGHQGSGRLLDVNLFVWVRDPLEAMIKYKRMGGIKRSRTPDIVPLDPKESLELERRIINEGLSLDRVKRKWYTTTRQYRWW